MYNIGIYSIIYYDRPVSVSFYNNISLSLRYNIICICVLDFGVIIVKKQTFKLKKQPKKIKK